MRETEWSSQYLRNHQHNFKKIHLFSKYTTHDTLKNISQYAIKWEAFSLRKHIINAYLLPSENLKWDFHSLYMNKYWMYWKCNFWSINPEDGVYAWTKDFNLLGPGHIYASVCKYTWTVRLSITKSRTYFCVWIHLWIFMKIS